MGGLNFICNRESYRLFVRSSRYRKPFKRISNYDNYRHFVELTAINVDDDSKSKMNLVFIRNCSVKEKKKRFKTTNISGSPARSKRKEHEWTWWRDLTTFSSIGRSLDFFFFFGQPVFSSPFIRRKIVIYKYSKLTISRLNFIKHSWNCCMRGRTLNIVSIFSHGPRPRQQPIQ